MTATPEEKIDHIVRNTACAIRIGKSLLYWAHAVIALNFTLLSTYSRHILLTSP